MRLIDADKIEYTHAIARCIEDGHNWNELCVTKDDIEEEPTVDAVPKEELLKMLDAVTDIWFWEHIGTVCNSKPVKECAGCKYEGHPFGKCLLKYLEERKEQ